jgi:GNAT superfamily N-acetyltransferase
MRDVIVCGAREIEPVDLERFGRLTRRRNSHLRTILMAAGDGPVDAVMVAVESLAPAGHVLGWSAAWIDEAEPAEVALGVYVRAGDRRRGIGSLLVAAIRHAARKRWPGLRHATFPVDDAGRGLYLGLGMSVPRPAGKRGAK